MYVYPVHFTISYFKPNLPISTAIDRKQIQLPKVGLEVFFRKAVLKSIKNQLGGFGFLIGVIKANYKSLKSEIGCTKYRLAVTSPYNNIAIILIFALPKQ